MLSTVQLRRPAVTDACESGTLVAPEKISDAADLLLGSCVDIVQARSQNLLDDEALDDSLLALREALVRLTKQAARSVRHPGENLLWFQSAMKDRD